MATKMFNQIRLITYFNVKYKLQKHELLNLTIIYVNKNVDKFLVNIYLILENLCDKLTRF